MDKKKLKYQKPVLHSLREDETLLLQCVSGSSASGTQENPGHVCVAGNSADLSMASNDCFTGLSAPGPTCITGVSAGDWNGCVSGTLNSQFYYVGRSYECALGGAVNANSGTAGTCQLGTGPT